MNTVDIKPRVSGYLVGAPFKEGSLVKKGDVLFEIDPRPYKADLDAAAAQILVAQAALDLARKALERHLTVAKSTPGALSNQQINQDRSAVLEAETRVRAGQAGLELRKLNLDFCTVRSPIDGRVGRYFLAVGNLVNKDKTLLTTVVSQDPMYAYFDIDEGTLVRLMKAVGEKRPKAANQEVGQLPVYLGLAAEEGFPHQGLLDFVNNQVNPNTGTLALRAVFPNPALPGGSRWLVPGMFARIRMAFGPPHPALLVSDRVIASEQGTRYVFVVDAQNKL